MPIWVGGKTAPALRRVACYGTGYHTIGATPQELAAEIAAMRVEVERVGRDPDDIVVSMLWSSAAGLDRGRPLVDLLGEYAAAGLHHLVGTPWLAGPPRPGASTHDRLAATLDNLERVAAEVLPALR